jgi:anti-anti-sigma factor
MGVTTQLDGEGQNLTIRVAGRFDTDSHLAFRQAYENHPSNLHYVVDLSAVEQLDSSALGLLLLLREHAGGDQGRVSLRGASRPVRDILELSRFERLFEMDQAD